MDFSWFGDIGLVLVGAAALGAVVALALRSARLRSRR